MVCQVDTTLKVGVLNLEFYRRRAREILEGKGFCFLLSSLLSELKFTSVSDGLLDFVVSTFGDGSIWAESSVDAASNTGFSDFSSFGKAAAALVSTHVAN